MRTRVLLAAATMAAGVTTGAQASNGNLPRTPVIHVGEQCLTRVDRSVASTTQLEYTIPMPDTCLGDDELPDSRTHQFVALCRTPEPGELLPQWLAHADVDRAAAIDQLPDPPPGPQDVLDLAAAWQGCSHRIVADDARRTIDCNAALAGVAWDTSTVPAGAWVVQGYTFDPPVNLWRPRRGVFKLVDGDGDDPPAVALQAHALQLGSENSLELRACADAAPGSTVRASWSRLDPIAWTEIDAQPVGEGGISSFSFVPPPDIDPGGTIVRFAVEVEDPSGRSFRYVSPDDVVIVPGALEPTPPGPVYDFCREHDDPLAPQNCGGGDDDSADGSALGERGCHGCSSTGGAPLGLSWLTAFALPRRRRR
ncbi:MAG: hypothetical protein U0168_02055 [Nannocystaceae bacterium]